MCHANKYLQESFARLIRCERYQCSAMTAFKRFTCFVWPSERWNASACKHMKHQVLFSQGIVYCRIWFCYCCCFVDFFFFSLNLERCVAVDFVSGENAFLPLSSIDAHKWRVFFLIFTSFAEQFTFSARLMKTIRQLTNSNGLFLYSAYHSSRLTHRIRTYGTRIKCDSNWKFDSQWILKWQWRFFFVLSFSFYFIA